MSGCAGERHEALKALLPPINQFELEKKCSVTTLDSLPGSICQKTNRKLNDVLLGAKHFSFRSSFFRVSAVQFHISRSCLLFRWRLDWGKLRDARRLFWPSFLAAEEKALDDHISTDD